MAVVIQQPDALAPLESAAEGYTQGRDKAMALALAKEKQASDERNQTRTLDLQQSQVESENKSRDIQNKIAEAKQEAEQRMEPYMVALRQAQIKAQGDASAQSEAATALSNVQREAAQVKLDLEKKYGPKMAEDALKAAGEDLKTKHALATKAEFDAQNAPKAAKAAQDQSAALTGVYRHEANAPYPQQVPPGGAAAKRTETEDTADLQLGQQTIDDLLQRGIPQADGSSKPVTPPDVERMIRSSNSYSAPVKLKLIAYLRSKGGAHPAAPAAAPPLKPAPVHTMAPSAQPAFSPPQVPQGGSGVSIPAWMSGGS